MSARVLLVAPTFHGYWRSVAHALRSLGEEVVVHLYDERPRARDKVRTKLLEELPQHIGLPDRGSAARAATAAARAAMAASGADVVLGVRCDLLLDDFWDDVAHRRLASVLWLYDELDRVPIPIDRLRGLDLVATYSPSDERRLAAAGVTARTVHNAFDPTLAWRPIPSTGPILVGARYPGREETLTALRRDGIAVHAVGRDWSRHPVDRLRTWSLHRPPLPAQRDVPRGRALGMLAGAPAALNLHERQDGFTMRTFEACGVGALQLIDRDDVGELYEPGAEVIPFGAHDELVELCRRALVDHVWHERVGAAARARTLAAHTFTHRLRTLAEVWR